MNREILFRGKRVDSSEWFEGSYWLSRSAVRETTYITDGYGNLFCVIPETVGQYTGLNDFTTHDDVFLVPFFFTGKDP